MLSRWLYTSRFAIVYLLQDADEAPAAAVEVDIYRPLFKMSLATTAHLKANPALDLVNNEVVSMLMAREKRTDTSLAEVLIMQEMDKRMCDVTAVLPAAEGVMLYVPSVSKWFKADDEMLTTKQVVEAYSAEFSAIRQQIAKDNKKAQKLEGKIETVIKMHKVGTLNSLFALSSPSVQSAVAEASSKLRSAHSDLVRLTRDYEAMCSLEVQERTIAAVSRRQRLVDSVNVERQRNRELHDRYNLLASLKQQIEHHVV